MTRRLSTQVYIGLLITALLCAELTLFALVVGEGFWRADPPAAVPESRGVDSAPPSPAKVADSFARTLTVQISSAARTLVGPRAQLFVGIVLVSVALGARPISRRITRRLERLQKSVDELGAGDLSARVEVEGGDEVSGLARSFNRAAQRIQGLLEAERRLLAGASHELRTPLTRVRVALEVLDGELEARAGSEPTDQAANRKLLHQAESDIDELDALIGDLLLAASLSARRHLNRVEPVELMSLLGEEAARYGLELLGKPVSINGDPLSLRRMMRNLLDNAWRHAGGKDVATRVDPLPEGKGGGARLMVGDRGPGLSDTDRERIFEAFYRPRGNRESIAGGAGLGLTLVREIARFHGGDACCRSREGGGTLIEVDLRGATPT